MEDNPCRFNNMTHSKKVKPSKATQKVVVPKDSAEIDDLFSVLSRKKLSVVTVEKATKEDVKKEEKKKLLTKKMSAEVTLSDLEGLDEDEDNFDESDDADNVDLAHGTAFDPKKDDHFPVASVTVTTAAPCHTDDSDFFDSRGLKRKTRALTEDGFPIFTPNELKIGMGGGTDLCPFDCNCCY